MIRSHSWCYFCAAGKRIAALVLFQMVPFLWSTCRIRGFFPIHSPASPAENLKNHGFESLGLIGDNGRLETPSKRQRQMTDKMDSKLVSLEEFRTDFRGGGWGDFQIPHWDLMVEKSLETIWALSKKVTTNWDNPPNIRLWMTTMTTQDYTLSWESFLDRRLAISCGCKRKTHLPIDFQPSPTGS